MRSFTAISFEYIASFLFIFYPSLLFQLCFSGMQVKWSFMNMFRFLNGSCLFNKQHCGLKKIVLYKKKKNNICMFLELRTYLTKRKISRKSFNHECNSVNGDRFLWCTVKIMHPLFNYLKHKLSKTEKNVCRAEHPPWFLKV